MATIPKLFPYVKKISVINEYLYLYYQREGSVMHSKNVERNRDIIDAVDGVIKYYTEVGLFEKYKAELEYLATLHVYVLACQRVVKIDASHELLTVLSDYLKSIFPDYKKNKYYIASSKKIKLIAKLLDFKQYKALAFLLKVKEKIK